MNQEKIIQAIAAYLEKETIYRQNGRQGVTTEFLDEYPTHSIAVAEYAAKIMAAIAPHLEAGAGWEDAPVWGNYRTEIDGDVYFFEDIFLPCRYVKYGDKTGSTGTFFLQIQGRDWSGNIEKRPR